MLEIVTLQNGMILSTLSISSHDFNLNFSKRSHTNGDESSTSANLGNDRGFIIKKYYLHWCETFWEAQSKDTRAYSQSEQYHTIIESQLI